MRRVTLEEFLRQARPYERWRAPFDLRLHQSLRWSALCIALMCLLLWDLPWLAASFGGLLWVVDWARPALVALNVASVLLAVALLKRTHGLRAGRPAWHWAALALSVVGVADGFILASVIASVVGTIGLSALGLALSWALGTLGLLWHLLTLIVKLLLWGVVVCLALTLFGRQRLELFEPQARGKGGQRSRREVIGQKHLAFVEQLLRGGLPLRLRACGALVEGGGADVDVAAWGGHGCFPGCDSATRSGSTQSRSAGGCPGRGRWRCSGEKRW
jgi:hypothetical protein